MKRERRISGVPTVARGVRQASPFGAQGHRPVGAKYLSLQSVFKISFSSFRSEIIREDVAPKGAMDFICDRYYKYVAPSGARTVKW